MSSVNKACFHLVDLDLSLNGISHMREQDSRTPTKTFSERALQNTMSHFEYGYFIIIKWYLSDLDVIRDRVQSELGSSSDKIPQSDSSKIDSMTLSIPSSSSLSYMSNAGHGRPPGTNPSLWLSSVSFRSSSLSPRLSQQYHSTWIEFRCSRSRPRVV